MTQILRQMCWEILFVWPLWGSVKGCSALSCQDLSFLVGRRSAVPSIIRSLFPLLSFSSIFSQASWLASGHAGLHTLSRLLFFVVFAFRAGRQTEKEKDSQQDSDSIHPLHFLANTRGVKLPWSPMKYIRR